MALITITGYPCSGKTRRADQLKASFDARLRDPNYTGPQLKVAVISDDSLDTTRDAYKGAPYLTIVSYKVLTQYPTTDTKSEKPARAALFAAVQRQLGQDTITIVDGMNYIKGFRYQMYCAAREFKLRVCTVSVMFLSADVDVVHSCGERSRSSLSPRQIFAKSGTRRVQAGMRMHQKRMYTTSLSYKLSSDMDRQTRQPPHALRRALVDGPLGLALVHRNVDRRPPRGRHLESGNGGAREAT